MYNNNNNRIMNYMSLNTLFLILILHVDIHIATSHDKIICHGYSMLKKRHAFNVVCGFIPEENIYAMATILTLVHIYSASSSYNLELFIIFFWLNVGARSWPICHQLTMACIKINQHILQMY